MVSCVVALFFVGKLLGDLNPTDFLSFLHTGLKEPQTHTFYSQGGHFSSSPRPKPGLSWSLPGHFIEFFLCITLYSAPKC